MGAPGGLQVRGGATAATTVSGPAGAWPPRQVTGTAGTCHHCSCVTQGPATHGCCQPVYPGSPTVLPPTVLPPPLCHPGPCHPLCCHSMCHPGTPTTSPRALPPLVSPWGHPRLRGHLGRVTSGMEVGSGGMSPSCHCKAGSGCQQVPGGPGRGRRVPPGPGWPWQQVTGPGWHWLIR